MEQPEVAQVVQGSLFCISHQTNHPLTIILLMLRIQCIESLKVLDQLSTYKELMVEFVIKPKHKRTRQHPSTKAPK